MKASEEPRRTGIRGLMDRYPRLWLSPFSVLLGVVGAVGYARNGEGQMAIFSVVRMTAFGLVAALSKDEYFVAGTGEGDERQRAIELEASRFSLHCVTVLAVAGFIWEIYTRSPGEPPGIFTLFCVVGAGSHMFAFAYLRRRR